jgi:hypothetical protein
MLLIFITMIFFIRNPIFLKKKNGKRNSISHLLTGRFAVPSKVRYQHYCDVGFCRAVSFPIDVCSKYYKGAKNDDLANDGGGNFLVAETTVNVRDSE